MESILYLIFNRPEYAKQSFEGIRVAKPKRLYVFADGPRDNRPGEAELCQETRKIIDGVDWDCEVITNFQDENIGMNKANLMALDWYFEHEEYGVYIEDDIVMVPGSAEFYSQMLLKYSGNKQVGFITGCNPLGQNITSNEYFFAVSPFGCYGLATWRNVWVDFRKTVKEFSYEQLVDIFAEANRNRPKLLKLALTAHRKEKLMIEEPAWDIYFTPYCLLKKKYSILSKANLISCIGLIGTHSIQAKYIQTAFGTIDAARLTGPEDPVLDSAMGEALYDHIESMYPITFWQKIVNLVAVFSSVRSIGEFNAQVRLFFKRRVENFKMRVLK